MSSCERLSSEPSVTPSRRSSPAARGMVALVVGYQTLRAGQLSPCRFYPSCSIYAVEAIETHGAVRGVGLALRRLLRCHPFGRHGIDLVPPRGARR
jgi:uncharacterized protein